MIDEEMRELIAEAIKTAVGQAGRTTVGDQDMIHTLHEEMWATMNNIADSLPNTAGMDVPGEGVDSVPGCYEITAIDDDSITMANRLLAVGGRIYYQEGEITVRGVAGKVVYLKVSASAEDDTVSIGTAAGFAELAELSKSMDSYYMPLYQISEEGAVAVDLRNMPQAMMTEVG